MLRRFVFQMLALLAAAAMTAPLAAAQTASQSGGAKLHWLGDNAPKGAIGASWGVPWPAGTVQKSQKFALKSAAGADLPLQSWPLAYWPDGSIKWTGFATVANASDAGELTISPAASASATSPSLSVSEAPGGWLVKNGTMEAKLGNSGANLIQSISIDGREVVRNGHLEAINQVGPETGYLKLAPREEYVSEIKKVTMEQDGPVRAVFKFEGMHKAVGGSREWLPFVVRLYFFAGIEPIKVVHTIMFDGDKEKDFVRGLDLAFDVPLRGGPRERTVRFGNSNGGMWSEALMTGGGFGGRGGRGGGGDAENPSAKWDIFKLTQPNSDGFRIVKRTNEESSWVDAGEGQRASGYAFVGDDTGGLGVAVKNFWESYPSALEISGATGDAAHARAWIWSPDGPAMDMRFYDTHGHGDVNRSGNYEDYEAGFDDPVGIARTSDLMLFPTGTMPTREASAADSAMASVPPLPTVSPETLHATGIFGVWSLPDRSTPFKASVEDRLAGAIKYYEGAIDQHHWYGFWNYGDVRHSYDAARHEWRYDVGGYAWDNSELGSVLWMWYSYVRTGDADTFRMAEALTRHTSEVDTYHFGRFEGLGSRHNVVHWGDSAKEARISQAPHNRFYYYLTTDERVGDVMRMVLVADKVSSELDPMRKAQPKTEAEAKYPGRIRVGPDWLAFVGNWMTEWERTGDTKWRDKIMAGVDSLAGMDYWMRSGKNLVVGYDPATGKMYQTDDTPGNYNLPTIQGGAEVAIELTSLLKNDTWTKMWLQYCRLGAAPAEVLKADQKTGTEGSDASMVGEAGGSRSQGSARLAAYAYYMTKVPAFADFALQRMDYGGVDYTPVRIDGAESLNPVDEVRGASTNTAAQSSLMDIEMLEMLKDKLPTDAPPPPAQRGFGGRGGAGAGAGFGGRGGAGGGGGRGGAAQ